MNKYPLIGGCILVVVLLVLGSLTNVVGYQTVKSTVVNDSPLFRTRTQRATNQPQNILTVQYLGKGTENLLQFPLRDNKTEQLKNAIGYISKMDDKTFAQFTDFCIKNIKQSNTLRDTNPTDILQMFHQLRTKSKIINDFMNENAFNPPSILIFTLCYKISGCILANILVYIFVFLFNIYELIYLFAHVLTMASCRSSCICIH